MPTWINDELLTDDAAPVRFHYADGRSSEGGRYVPVRANLAGVLSAFADTYTFDVYQLQEGLLNADLGMRIDGEWDFDTEIALGQLVMPFDDSFVVEPNGTDVTIRPGGKAGISSEITHAAWAAMLSQIRALPPRPTVGPVQFATSELQAALQELRHSVVPLITGEWSIGTRDALATAMPTGVSIRVLDDGGINITNGPFGQPSIRLHVFEGDASIVTRLKEAAPLLVPAPSDPVAVAPVPIVPQEERSERFRPPTEAQPDRSATKNTPPPDSIDGLTVKILLRTVGFYDKPLLSSAASDADYVWTTEVKRAFDRWATNRTLRYQLTRDELREDSDGSLTDTWQVVEPEATFDQLGREATDLSNRARFIAAAEEAGVGIEFVETAIATFQTPPAAKAPSLWPWALIGGAALGVGYIATRRKSTT